MYQTPILFLIFNRPDCTEKVFEILKQIKPSKLFVAADGPRYDRNEEDLCNRTRSIISNVNWECEVVTLFRDKNLGCKDAVSDAVKWFFSKVEYGIILEDDCIPDHSFFKYSEELLIKYKDDERIGMVCGRNEYSSTNQNDSYSFSTAGSIWGWGSWKRVIENYDENNQELLVDFKQRIYEATLDKFERDRLYHQLKWTLDGSLNTWDYQLHALLKFNSMLYIIPKSNLIKNIGFGVDATHTVSVEQRTHTPVKSLEFPLVHPKWIIPDRKLSKEIVRADSNKIWIWIYLLVINKIRQMKSNKKN
jgi:hypothetical protein